MSAEKEYPKNILLAVDGSDHAVAAAALVGNLQLTTQHQVTVITVLVPRHAQFSTSVERFLEQATDQLRGSPATVHTQVVAGYPAEILTQMAQEYQHDLTVLGAKGLRATLGILLGGVAQQVVEYSCCPVLVVRAPYRGLRQILLVVDGSTHSQSALQYLAQFALPKDAAVHLLYVAPPDYQSELILRGWPVGFEAAPPILTADIQAKLEEEAKAELQRGEETLQNSLQALKSKGIEATSALRRGDAATEILAYAQHESIDLIVAGSRGLSQMQSWLLGSVSRKLVHYSQCSVLIVKAPPSIE